MINIIAYSLFELASAFAPSSGWFLVLRALLRFRHGRRVGRGRRAGIRDACRPKAAASSPGFCRKATSSAICWPRSSSRRPSITSAGAACSSSARCPALLVLYIRSNVEESPAWVKAARAKRAGRARTAEPRRRTSAVPVPHPADGRVQLLQPRHPGSLSHLPSGAARLHAGIDRPHRHHLQPRRASGRHRLRRAVGAHRAPPGHRARGAAGAADDPALGLFAPRRCCSRSAAS